MTPLLLASRNAGKLRELRRMLAGTKIEVVSLDDRPEVGEVEETGETFEENAKLKAVSAALASGLWSLGEDSGLEVDALDGAPGGRSARFAGSHGDDAANNAKLLRELDGVSERGARYVSVFVLARPGGEVVAVVRGTCEGRIATAPRGDGGFGYDPLFVSSGHTRTNAELAPEEKDAISHRGVALRELLPDLERHLLGS